MTLIQPWPPSLMRRTGPVWGCYFWTEGLQPASGLIGRGPGRDRSPAASSYGRPELF